MISEFKKTSFLFGGNTVFVEEIYRQYIENPNSVDPSWQDFFKTYKDQSGNMTPSWGSSPKIMGAFIPEAAQSQAQSSTNTDALSLRAELLINAYRQYGHYLANLDPLGMEFPKTKKDVGLEVANFGVSEDDLSKVITIKGKSLALSNLISMLDATYAKNISMECNHLQSIEEITWLYDKFESQTSVHLNAKEKTSILENLIAAAGMEHYLHIKFPGAKRFSVEGGESVIAALEYTIESFSKIGIKEAVLGMAHRGRLSTLTRVMGKPYRALFSEFMGKAAFSADLGIAGDVKYHMGYNSEKKFESGSVKMSLLPNPSHLEAVNPLVAGAVRAKQDILGDKNRRAITGILIHGDAAFCGQGVVAESLSMSNILPYSVGGILHFVINNQVGFTANSRDTRASRYSTEMAKMSGSPIFHVNGDDAESVIFATNLALEYKHNFGKDAVVEIICYRKYGHNEGDEPMYTQPEMYELIKQKQTPADIYAAKLEREGVVSAADYKKLQDKFKVHLDEEFSHAESYKAASHKFDGLWSGFSRNGKEVETGVDKEKLKRFGSSLCTIPDNFALNAKLKKLLDQRKEDFNSEAPLDWAAVEQLAYASLLSEGTSIRITGQDAGRGTFSHRHSVLHDQVNSSRYVPLNNLSHSQTSSHPEFISGSEGIPKQVRDDNTQFGTYEVADSNLSEFAVLGFEYGYSIINPKQLVIWEAQFGDFANGAQIIFDQFISSSETKWMQMSGLVVLLPHGYEGQGPEHSSARLERFLQLCGEDNIQVAYPSTPTSFFHLIRRQLHRNFRKPLIVMTPKSLLRHKVTLLSELSKGTKFTPVIDDESAYNKATRLVVSSGKIYYDLVEARAKKGTKNVAFIRMEQLYPFPKEEFKKIIAGYKSLKEVVWCQEEPQNMGAWSFIKPYLEEVIGDVKLSYIGRKVAASPAVGYLSVHNAEQAAIIEAVIR